MTNYIFLFVFALLTNILIYHNLLIFVLIVGFIVLSVLRWLTYNPNKRKALEFRNKAIEAFNNNIINETKLNLEKGINYASKMIYLPHGVGYLTSDLQKLMEKENEMIQKYLDRDNLENKKDFDDHKDFFTIPKISKKELRRYIIIFFLLSLILYFTIYLFLLI